MTAVAGTITPIIMNTMRQKHSKALKNLKPKNLLSLMTTKRT